VTAHIQLNVTVREPDLEAITIPNRLSDGGASKNEKPFRWRGS